MSVVYDVIIYHSNCADGSAAAWIYDLWFTTRNKNDDKFSDHHKNRLPYYCPLYHGTDEQKKEKLPKIKNKNVLILDFSFCPDTMNYIKENANEVKLIDHHVSAMNQLKDLDYCLFDLEKSACVMTWNYFFPDQEIPKFLKYIEDRDLCLFNLPETKFFSRWLFHVGFKNQVFYELMKLSNYENQISEGQIFLKADERHINSFVRSAVKCKFLDKYTVYYVGNKMFRTEVSEILLSKDEVDFIVCGEYSVKMKNWSLSMKSKKSGIDVQKIAELYGGGGHTNASKILYDGHLCDILKDI